jgi:hypothetical protein
MRTHNFTLTNVPHFTMARNLRYLDLKERQNAQICSVVGRRQGDQIGRIFAYILGDSLLWTVF